MRISVYINEIMLIIRAFISLPIVPVGGHQPLYPFMRSAKIVIVHEPPAPPPRTLQVQEDGRLQKLTPQRSPESFDLAQRLGTAWTGHDLADATLLQLLGGRTLAPPGDILRT